MTEQRGRMEELVSVLIERETLNADEFVQIVEGAAPAPATFAPAEE